MVDVGQGGDRISADNIIKRPSLAQVQVSNEAQQDKVSPILPQRPRCCATHVAVVEPPIELLRLRHSARKAVEQPRAAGQRGHALLQQRQHPLVRHLSRDCISFSTHTLTLTHRSYQSASGHFALQRLVVRHRAAQHVAGREPLDAKVGAQPLALRAFALTRHASVSAGVARQPRRTRACDCAVSRLWTRAATRMREMRTGPAQQNEAQRTAIGV